MSAEAVCDEYSTGLLGDPRRVLGNGSLWRERWDRWVPDFGLVEGHAPGWRAADREVDRWTVQRAMVDRKWGLSLRDVVEASWLELDVDCHEEVWDPAWDDVPGASPSRRRGGLNALLGEERVRAVLARIPMPWLVLASPRGFRLRLRFSRAHPIERVERLGRKILEVLDLPFVEAFPRRHESGRLGYSRGLHPVKADLVSRVGGGAKAWMIREMTGEEASISKLERLIGIRPDRAPGRGNSRSQVSSRNTEIRCKSSLGGRVSSGGRGGAPGLGEHARGADFASLVVGVLRDGVPAGESYFAAGKLAFAATCAGLDGEEALAVGESVAARMGSRRRAREWSGRYREKLRYYGRAGLEKRLRNPAVIAWLERALGRAVVVPEVREGAAAPAEAKDPAAVSEARRRAAAMRWALPIRDAGIPEVIRHGWRKRPARRWVGPVWEARRAVPLGSAPAKTPTWLTTGSRSRSGGSPPTSATSGSSGVRTVSSAGFDTS